MPATAAGRAVCDMLNTLGQAPGTATVTGTHDTPQVPSGTPSPNAAPLHVAQWAPNTGDNQSSCFVHHMRAHPPPPPQVLGHTIQLCQAAHPLLLKSVLAASRKDARYNLLLQWLPSVLLTNESMLSIILLPAAEALSPANRSHPSPQSCPRSPRWLGQPRPSLSPQPDPRLHPARPPPSIPVSQGVGRMEREGKKTYGDRVLFFFKGIKREEFLFDFPAALDRCLWETVPEA